MLHRHRAAGHDRRVGLHGLRDLQLARVEGRPRSRRHQALAGQRRHRARPGSSITTVAGPVPRGLRDLRARPARGRGRRPGTDAAVDARRRKDVLQVQVIGQQWKWTYRYPTFGGFETNELVVPVEHHVAFHVTSLDVIHDFWAYQLGVKADANPSADNVAFTTPVQLGTFIVRCDELCGLWHGAMYNAGTGGVADRLRVLGDARRSSCSRQNTAYLPAVRVHLRPRRQRCGRRVLPRHRRPLQPRRDLRGADARGRTDDDGAAGHDDGGLPTDGAGHERPSRRRASRASTPARCRCTRRRASPLSPWLRPHILWAAAGAVGGYVVRPLAGQPHRRRLPGRAEHRRRTTSPRARRSCFGVVGWLAGIGALNVPAAQDRRPRARAVDARHELDALLQDDRGPQGRRACSTPSAS